MAKDDHFVAQTYLRSFVDDEGNLTPYYKNGRVIVGKKKTPRQVCYKTDGDSNIYFDNMRILDEYLPHIENPWAENVAKLEAGRVDADCKYEIGAYISFLRSCTPTAKRFGADMISANMQPLVNRTLAEHFHELGETTDEIQLAMKDAMDNREIRSVVDEEYVHAISIQHLIHSAYRFYCSHWLVLLNETGIPFVTSDNPAGLFYDEGNPQYATVFLPLSPTLGVLIKPDLTIARPMIEDVKRYSHSGDDYAHPKKSFVATLNELTIRSAENTVLHSAIDEDLVSLVEANRDWRVQNQSFELPYENGMFIINRQCACKNA
ncbi:DUF4238 domain-containing protein [Vreelandella titanicae]|uniref:DUF4238 domain-containing protein n=1 Tax=Vreelandella titanicae TaxID=664683 RepID=UPI0016440905|nr:DUF4238 domain-containing protein [Halomonas titanicae]